MASEDEMPRSFLRTAINVVTPEMMKHFEAAWAKAVADWDGKLVVVEPAIVLHDEWGVQFLSGAVEVCDSEQDAREWAGDPWPENRAPTVVRRKASDWQEVPDA